jgi:hypothetical protein
LADSIDGNDGKCPCQLLEVLEENIWNFGKGFAVTITSNIIAVSDV